MTAGPLLRAEGVTKVFYSGGLIRKGRHAVTAVDDIDFHVNEGESVGIAGETGSGKTTLARLLLGVVAPTSGHVSWRGKHLTELDRSEHREFRRSTQAVFQDPFSSLSPRMRVGEIIAEPGLATGYFDSRETARARVAEVAGLTGLPKDAPARYPHEFSGGQRQRIAIARAIAARPKIVILDEPVSSLDVSLRSQILNLLKDIRETEELATILISHDLATLRYMVDRVVVVNRGRVVESASTTKLYTRPAARYTRELLTSAGVPFDEPGPMDESRPDSESREAEDESSADMTVA